MCKPLHHIVDEYADIKNKAQELELFFTSPQWHYPQESNQLTNTLHQIFGSKGRHLY